MSEEAISGEEARSLWRRLSHTPLRDLLRGRLSGRLDLDHLLTQARLPEPAAKLVRQVVRRTRLWRLEKIDVATELIAHFQDGLGAGRSGEELVERFGEAKAAAKLIRRAKVRNRPLAWHVLRGARRTLAVLLVLYAAVWLWYWSGEARPTVDYLAQFNARALAVPEKEAAWPLYRQALLRLDPQRIGALMKPPRDAQSLRGAYVIPAPGDEPWLAAAAFLAKHQEELALVRQAAQREGLGMPTGILAEADLALWPQDERRSLPELAPNPRMELIFSSDSRHVFFRRHLAPMLIIDLRQAVENADGTGVLTDVGALLGMARQMREVPSSFHQFISVAAMIECLEEIGRTLRNHPESLRAEELRDLAHLLAQAAPLVTIELSAAHQERLDWLQWNYTPGGRITFEPIQDLLGIPLSYGLVGETDSGWILKLAPFLVAPRDQMREELEWMTLIAQQRQQAHPWERGPSPAHHRLEQWDRSPLGRLRYGPLLKLMGSLDDWVLSETHFRTRFDATLTAIALTLYHHRHGDWPASLDDLTPDLLPTAPLDPFDGQPLRYRLRDGRPLLYAIGPDREDDGGVHDPQAQSWRPAEEIDASFRREHGDWVLWPASEPR